MTKSLSSAARRALMVSLINKGLIKSQSDLVKQLSKAGVKVTQATLTLDDGADLIMRVHTKYPELAQNVYGGTEETTTGVHRFRAMAADGKLLYPVDLS